MCQLSRIFLVWLFALSMTLVFLKSIACMIMCPSVFGHIRSAIEIRDIPNMFFI